MHAVSGMLRVVHASGEDREAAVRLRHIAGTQWGTKRYLRMDLLQDLDVAEACTA